MAMAMLERVPTLSPLTQGWKQFATAGVVGKENGTTVEQLVWKYGNYQPHGHDGIDFGCPLWTPIYAPGPGIVDWAGWSHEMPLDVVNKYGFLPRDRSGGIVTLLDHQNGLLSALLHLAGTDLNAGNQVVGGQISGYSGTTGRSGGPHLHWSVILRDFVYLTPMYGRIDPFSRVPEGTTIPIDGGSGGIGDGSTGKKLTLVGIPGIPIQQGA